MAEVTWFKVLTDIFSDDKIKIMQSMPEGDSITVMWFKVLAQAGKTNDGGYIYLKKNIPYTAGMLATLFNKPQQLVELALRTFSEFGMIDMDDRGYIFITNWEKHQNIAGMDKVREQNRVRNIKYREKKKQELMLNDVKRDVTGRSNDATEVELEVELEKENNTTLSGDPFEQVRIAFKLMHKMIDMPYKDSPLLTDLLKEFPADLIIGVMKEKFRENVKTLKYYEGAIRDTAIIDSSRRSNGNSKAAYYRPAPKIDAELDYRRREIAFNKWIESGGNPDEFEYGHASNH